MGNNAAEQDNAMASQPIRPDSVPATPVSPAIPIYRRNVRRGECALLLARRNVLEGKIQQSESLPASDSLSHVTLQALCRELAVVEDRLDDYRRMRPRWIVERPAKPRSWPGDNTRYAETSFETPCPTRTTDCASFLPTQTPSSPAFTIDRYSCQSDIAPGQSRKRAPSSSSVPSSPCAKRQQRSYLSTLPTSE